MKNEYRVGVLFLLIMFMALIYSPKVWAANGVVIDDQSCVAANGKVTFTVSIENAPANVSAFGLNISYDANILKYEKFTPSDLGMLNEDGEKEFTISYKKDETKPSIKVGGYYTGSGSTGFPAGASGTIGKVAFIVLSCEPATVGMNTLTDDIKTWPTQGGELKPPHSPVLQDIEDQVKMFDNQISFIAQATDEDGDEVIFSIANAPAGAYFNIQSGEFSWTPTLADVGNYPDITITAADSTGRNDSKTFQITVTGPHTPVFPAIAKQTIKAGSTLSLDVKATDMDSDYGDSIVYSAANLPAGAVLNGQSGNLSWTPTEAQVGSYSVTVTATDSTDRSSSTTVILEVILATLTIDNQACHGESGESVTFTVSLNGAPALVSSLGMEVTYDGDILEYVSSTKGDLTQGFHFLDVSKLVSKANTLRIGGVGGKQVIEAGSTGSICTLVFTVKNCGPALINLANLEDDIAGWSTKAGQLNVAPTIVCPANIVVEAAGPDGVSANNAQIQAFLNGASVHDAQGNPLSVTTTPALTVFGMGSTEVTFNTIDAAGNSASCKATVTVVDSIAPAIICPESITVDAVDAAGTPATNDAIKAFLKAFKATDAVNVVSDRTNAPAKFPMGPTKVTFTVADGAGNSSSCTANVTVADRTAPVITCPGSITVAAEGPAGTSASNDQIVAFLKSAAAMDSVDGVLDVIYQVPDSFALGTTEIMFSATDSAGNSASCPATVIVADKAAPVITCPGSITVEAEGPNGTSANNNAIKAFLNGALATDNIDSSVNITNSADAVFALGGTDVSFIAKDAAGNSSGCKGTVTVVDTTAPVITCPGDIKVVAEGPNGISKNNAAIQAFLNAATATDTVSGSVNVIKEVPSSLPIGETVVVFNAQDAAGNSANCTATVTVADNTPPVLTCPASVMVVAEGPNGVPASRSAIQLFLDSATAMDAEDGRVNVSYQVPSTFVLGRTPIVFSAQDTAGNSITCTAYVTVVDETAPVITCPGSITVEADGPNGVSASNAEIQKFLNGATAIDAVDGVVNVNRNATGATFGMGNTVVIFEATDKAFNTDSCTSVISVVDTTAPVITCPADIVVKIQTTEVSAANAKIKAFLNGATATDAIDGSVPVTYNAPATFKLGPTEVTFQAVDEAGNFNICKAKVTVQNLFGTGGLYSGAVTGGTTGTGYTGGTTYDLYGGGLYYGTYGTAPYYTPSTNLYQSFNQNLYGFQQYYNSYQQPSTWDTSLLWQTSYSIY